MIRTRPMVRDHEAFHSLLCRSAAAMREVFDEGSPTVLRAVGPLFSPAEVFDWIKRAHPPARANTSRDKIIALKQSWGLSPAPLPDSGPDPRRPAEIYRAGNLVLDPTPFLPAPDHATFDEWVEHGRTELGGEFGLQAPGLECVGWDVMERLRTLLDPILALTGPRSYRLNAFGGDYRRTPFGFHVDPHQEAVFQYVLTGRRRGLFWEGLTLSDDDAAWVEDSNGRVPPRREPEVVIDLEPGDLVFWPGTHVHGFETKEPSLALSIVIDRASPRRREHVVAGLEVATMAGKPALPAIEAREPFGEDDLVERRPAFSIAYERYDDTLIVGVCGRVFDWPDRSSIPAAIRLFEFLDTCGPISLRNLIESCADASLPAEEIRGTVTMLANLGLFR